MAKVPGSGAATDTFERSAIEMTPVEEHPSSAQLALAEEANRVKDAWVPPSSLMPSKGPTFNFGLAIPASEAL